MSVLKHFNNGNGVPPRNAPWPVAFPATELNITVLWRYNCFIVLTEKRVNDLLYIDSLENKTTARCTRSGNWATA